MAVSPTVLLVDDSSQDVALIREAFREVGSPAELRAVHSVDEAVAYFEGHGPFADRANAPPPAFVLLDIQMPGRTGFDLLMWLRRDAPESWRRVPVIMLTTSHDFVEIRRAYDLGANSFLVKPTGFEELVTTVRQVVDYWLKRNRPAS